MTIRTPRFFDRTQDSSTTSDRPKRSGVRSGLLAVVGALCIGAFTLGATQAAEAAVYRYNVLNVTSSSNFIGGVIASCTITTGGGTCVITKGKTATRNIELSVGASRADVSAGLKISATSSVTTTVGCTSPALKSGQTWRAHAVGTQYRYNLQKQEAYKPRVGPTYWKTVETSGKLTAFNPSPSAISCGL
ncbi:hypothetical protein [Microbacterium sp.]|uniref:hypothetical protein n=1 Tax=Microbacterium sp. TaxID=51671 RepID=UPI002FE27567